MARQNKSKCKIIKSNLKYILLMTTIILLYYILALDQSSNYIFMDNTANPLILTQDSDKSSQSIVTKSPTSSPSVLPSKSPSLSPTIKPSRKPRKKHQHQHSPQSLVNAIHSIQSWPYIQDNISTATDVIKYNKTYHTLCDTHYYSRSMVGAHHKV